MHTIRSTLICGLSFGLAGCATHPLPEDTTRDNTFEIVQSIRCETRGAITSALASELDRWDSSKELAHSLRTGELPVKEFATIYDAGGYKGAIGKESRQRIDTYRNSVIGFDFSFDIEENNDETANAKLVSLLTLGTFDLEMKIGNEKKRKNERKFRVLAHFSDYIKDPILIKQCLYPVHNIANWVYPITGTIGVEEIIHTYLEVALYSGIDNTQKFTDIVSFRTKFYGQADPKITITTKSGDFYLDKAGGQIKADRIDTHKVTVAVSLDTSLLKPKPPGQAATARPPATDAMRAVEQSLDEQQYFGVQRDILRRLQELEE